MKRLLTTAATALVLSTSAYADTQVSNSGKIETPAMEYAFDAKQSLSASELISMRVYASEKQFDPAMKANKAAQTEWDDIGEINDIILTRSGKVEAVIVGVGGFLGIGEKDVALDMSKIKIMKEADDADDYFLVVTATPEMLKNAQPYERMSAHKRNHDGNKDNEYGWAPFSRPDVTQEGYKVAERVDMTAENLTGARVYDAAGDDIGEVSEVVLNDEGTVENFVLDIGGFFGIGETDVPVSFDELNIQRSDDGKEFRVFIDATQEGLKERVDTES